MSRTVYRWIDALGNENIKHIDEFDKDVHQEIIRHIFDHRDTFRMKNCDLKLIITINDKYWSSYNVLLDNDVVIAWRLHSN